MLYWCGCSIRKLTVWPLRLSFGTGTSCKISDNLGFILMRCCTNPAWCNYNHSLHLRQLFFMPCGVTCQVRSREVPINDGTWRFRYSLCYVCIENYREVFCGSYKFSGYFYREPYNKTLWIISSVYVVLALLLERLEVFYIISFY